MRTVILLGALIIADAIRGTTVLPYNQNTLGFIAFVLFASILMDIADVARGKEK
jgi:hypothetical protein